jgi:SpoVK/Ycf46/Vps4 family AAA+-type ATPase
MGELAARLSTTWTWDDIVLAESDLALLRTIVGFVRHRDRVLDDWGFGALDGRRGGLVALFSGESGTGKTMAAQVIANDLGLEAYRVDLAGVVSKYIGETEKNLDRIFRVAEHANAVLVFDEADALFGKRSAVSDARDRYANLEVAYLLQRVETYPGVVILTTNLRQDVDQAFMRRIDVAIDFAVPGPAERARLWRRNLPARAPVQGDLDLDRLAASYPMAGGAIRNCARAAAFAAASDGGVIAMSHVEQAVALELRKLGRLSVGRS